MASIHGSAVLLGPKAVLIRGASGSGKSRLVRALLDWARDGRHGLPQPVFVRLVADDRVLVEAAHGRLLARPPQAIAGLMEMRGAGILAEPHEPVAVVGLVVDLNAADAERLPAEDAGTVCLEGVTLPRLPVAAGADALALTLRRCPWLERAAGPVAAPHQGQYP